MTFSKSPPAWLKAPVDVVFYATLMAFGVYVYYLNPGEWIGLGGILLAVFVGLSAFLKLWRYVYRKQTLRRMRVDIETTVEQHPGGCMCPYCCEARAESGQEVNPHD